MTMTQHDKMRELYSRFGNNEEILIREYAVAKRRGEVARKSNKNHMPAEEYAVWLLADERKKGWIPGIQP